MSDNPIKSDTTIKKVDGRHSPRGELGQKYLASGKRMSMRLWEESPGAVEQKPETRRDYETVGYVLSGKAELRLEGQTVLLEPGDSWVVPEGSLHSYRLLEPFAAIEATCPPSHVQGRDRSSKRP